MPGDLFKFCHPNSTNSVFFLEPGKFVDFARFLVQSSLRNRTLFVLAAVRAAGPRRHAGMSFLQRQLRLSVAGQCAIEEEVLVCRHGKLAEVLAACAGAGSKARVGRGLRSYTTSLVNPPTETRDLHVVLLVLQSLGPQG